MTIKKFILFAVIGFGYYQSGICQTQTDHEIETFLPYAYTSGFTKGIEYSFALSGESGSLVINGHMTYQQDAGQKVKKFGKDWIGTPQKGSIKILEDNSNIDGLDLYDIKSKLKIFSIDLTDGQITQYVWKKTPSKMKNGETIAVARTTKRTADGKILETGTLEWSFLVASTGYEFCEIEKSIDKKSKEESASRDCSVFDKSKQLVGGYIEIFLDQGVKISGGGPVKIR